MRNLAIKTTTAFAICCAILFGANSAHAARAQVYHPTLSYDLSGSSGTYGDLTYSEIQLGLNWYVVDWLNWRNSVFTRFGSKIDTVTGIDTALLATTEAFTEGGGLGIRAFAGPGYRIANRDNSAVFGEAGLVFALGGLHLGVGLKSLYYNSPRVDSNGYVYPKNDNQIFLIIGGGGVL